MLQFLILCILFQSALLSTVHHNHERNFQNGVIKHPLKNDKTSHQTSEKILDIPKIEEEPQFNDNVNEKAAFLNIKRPSGAMALFKQFQPKLKSEYHKKILGNRNTKEFKERGLIKMPNKKPNGLNNKQTLISGNKYPSQSVGFKIESKRRKRSVNTTSENVTTDITTNITHNNVTAPVRKNVIAEDITVNNSRYNDSSNELSLNERLPTVLDGNLNLNKDLELKGRRSYVPTELFLNEKQELRDKIENVIRGIKQKVIPLTNVKLALADKYNYRIGYVIANIDTLYNQLGKLKDEMNFQDEDSLKKLFERMKIADYVMSNLLQILNSYLTSTKASSL